MPISSEVSKSSRLASLSPSPAARGDVLQADLLIGAALQLRVHLRFQGTFHGGLQGPGGDHDLQAALVSAVALRPVFLHRDVAELSGNAVLAPIDAVVEEKAGTYPAAQVDIQEGIQVPRHAVAFFRHCHAAHAVLHQDRRPRFRPQLLLQPLFEGDLLPARDGEAVIHEPLAGVDQSRDGHADALEAGRGPAWWNGRRPGCPRRSRRAGGWCPRCPGPAADGSPGPGSRRPAIRRRARCARAPRSGPGTSRSLRRSRRLPALGPRIPGLTRRGHPLHHPLGQQPIDQALGRGQAQAAASATSRPDRAGAPGSRSA